MGSDKREGITPYRASQIVNAASAIVDTLVKGKTLYSPTFHECELAIELAAIMIRKLKDENKED